MIDPLGKTSYLVFDIKTLQKIQEVEVCLVDKNIPTNFLNVPTPYDEQWIHFTETSYAVHKNLTKVVSWANGNYILCPVY